MIISLCEAECGILSGGNHISICSTCSVVEGLVTNYSMIKTRKIAGVAGIKSNIKLYILSMKPINTLC